MTTQYAKAILAAASSLLHGTTAVEREWILSHLCIKPTFKTLRSPLGMEILKILKDQPAVNFVYIMKELDKLDIKPSKTELHNCLGHLKRVQLITSPRRGLFCEVILNEYNTTKSS